MKDLLLFVAIVGAWIVLQTWVLPRLGVPTSQQMGELLDRRLGAASSVRPQGEVEARVDGSVRSPGRPVVTERRRDRPSVGDPPLASTQRPRTS